MRVFVAGATGVVGRQLIPLLHTAGHDVFATSTSSAKLDRLREQGAHPVLLDILDGPATAKAVREASPDVIVHQATALSSMGMDVRHFDRHFAMTNRLRTTGLENLLAAGQDVGVQRYVVQSYCGWPFEATGTWVKSESAPLDPHPVKGFGETLAGIRRVEGLMVETPGGVALRFGALYGPGTSFDTDGPQAVAIRKRRFPIAGNGEGRWSFVHTYDAATATVAALTRGAGIYNIVDDDPAPVRDWLPYLAKVLGAPAPRRVPAWLGRIVAGEGAMRMMTQLRGGSNERAKQELSWKPVHSSWREGFRTEFGQATAAR